MNALSAKKKENITRNGRNFICINPKNFEDNEDDLFGDITIVIALAKKVAKKVVFA